MMEKIPTMLQRLVTASAVLAVLIFSPLGHSQTAPSQSKAPQDQKTAPAPPAAESVDVDGWGRPIATPVLDKSAPAPRHDISGTWDPRDAGIQPLGSSAMPEDGKPEHRLPFTALGQEALNRTKPSNTVRSVLPAETNDPVVTCDPQGMPREDLYELRTTQILQTPVKIAVLYEFTKIWRVIWTDGRELPKDPEPRWFGYSVGKWVDDYTLLVETTGLDERTWIDRAGRPHSSDLRVEERFHRVDRDHLELTVTINDPQMYTKPWVALDRLQFNLQPANFDVREMICSPSELAEYNKVIGNPASEKAH
jgi:hypothetical protein